MTKVPIVIIALNKNNLQSIMSSLNFNNVQLFGIITEMNSNSRQQYLYYKNISVPMYNFSEIGEFLKQGQSFVWLINGYVKGYSDIYKTKKFLISNGISEENIVNFEVAGTLLPYWSANVRYIEKNHADYFATGISYFEQGLNFQSFPKAAGVGVNLSISNQDLRQGYLTAKYVFEHVKPGSINFVLIGLTPYSLRYDNTKDFEVSPENLQYLWVLENSQDDSRQGQFLKYFVSDNFKKSFLATTAEQADLNYEKIKIGLNREFSANALATWEDELKNLTKKYFPDTVKQNVEILEEYIKLCLRNGAKPVGVVLPFSPMMHDNYSEEILNSFRLVMEQLQKIYDFTFIDMFDLPLDYSHFWNMSHLNWKGSIAASNVLNLMLHAENVLPFENLCQMNYNFFYNLSQHIHKSSYNELMERVFKISAEKIRRKRKIKVAFVVDDASMWCGDDIYNYFARNKRYEPTVFLCLRPLHKNFDTVVEELEHGVKQFKARNINVVGLKDPNADFPHQDIIFFLRQPEYYGKNLQLNVLTAETLLVFIPYTFNISEWDTSKLPLMKCIWKAFFETEYSLKYYDAKCDVGMPRGYYSGYPRLDVFFNNKENLKFEWKMAKPNAKKIIWAPHWSINSGVMYATFQWNYKFMYEYAKAHPEISWVVKPHPHLLHSAVEAGIFPDTEAFKAYLKKWNDLPNAKVETGAYYHAIFATSDGMIQDSGSFIAEYQYTHKPMIYLTRDTQKFNELAEELMKVLYRVDGKDLNAIAALMQKVFIEGKDEMYNARLNFFDKYCNYQKVNGMLASEFIFRQISKELE